METLSYYLDWVIALCGLDGSQGSLVLGWVVVSIAALLVVYAFYQGITSAIWPGESDPNHVKYRVLDDFEGEAERAD